MPKRADRQRGRRGDGALFFDPDKDRWVGKIIVDGRARKVLGASKSEARQRLNELRRDSDIGLPVGSGNMTLAELLRLWQEKALPSRQVSHSQATSHRWAIRILIEEVGAKRLRVLRPDDIEAAFQRRSVGLPVPAPTGRGRKSGGPLSRTSLIKIRSTLNQALNWAMRRDLVARNIAPLVELPAGGPVQRTGRAMNVDRALDFLAAAAGTPLEAMWITMLYLGLRPGEAAAIQWSDIDERRQAIHISRGRTVDATGRAVIGAPKTLGSIRSLDVPPVVLAALAKHRQAQLEQRVSLGELFINEHDLVFTSSTGLPTDPTGVRNEFARVIARTDLEGRWTPNDLRHSAASLMADAGMHIEQVADQLGHVDLRMLQKHYRHRLRPTVDGGTVVDSLLGPRSA